MYCYNRLTFWDTVTKTCMNYFFLLFHIEILRFLDVEIRMKGLYFANISNDRGQQNYSYTEFNVVCEF